MSVQSQTIVMQCVSGISNEYPSFQNDCLNGNPAVAGSCACRNKHRKKTHVHVNIPASLGGADVLSNCLSGFSSVNRLLPIADNRHPETHGRKSFARRKSSWRRSCHRLSERRPIWSNAARSSYSKTIRGLHCGCAKRHVPGRPSICTNRLNLGFGEVEGMC